jgi:hypothetical protein
MTDKNKDSLVKDILDLVSTSSNDFLQGLFPEKVDPSNKKRPPTAGDKIKVCPLINCTFSWIKRTIRSDFVHFCALGFSERSR